MKFYGKIIVSRLASSDKIPEEKEIYAEYSNHDSIMAAKSAMTRCANSTELFSWIQSWDDEKRVYTGKELRWKNWEDPESYTQNDGKRIRYSVKRCHPEFGETVESKYTKYGISAKYIVRLYLYWSDE